MAADPRGRRAADGRGRLVRTAVRDQHRLRAAGRVTVPHRAGHAGRGPQRGLHHSHDRRYWRERLRPRPRLHPGTVPDPHRGRGARRRQQGALRHWLAKWVPRCRAATHALQPIWSQAAEKPVTFATSYANANSKFVSLLEDPGLDIPKELDQ
ncbi:hypothetical protein LP418_20075 [Nocardioides sp. B-3]|nr:hypothetical protein [Nocardioides sp. B-3]UUZ58456.1 hypothetical protein LP418_20075 [Nocardioides sp. B-3]